MPFKVQCIISDYLVLSQVILKLQESQLPSDDKLTQYFIKYVKIHSTIKSKRSFSLDIKLPDECKVNAVEPHNWNLDNSNSSLSWTNYYSFPQSKFHWKLPRLLKFPLTRTVFCFPSEFELLGFYCICHTVTHFRDVIYVAGYMQYKRFFLSYYPFVFYDTSWGFSLLHSLVLLSLESWNVLVGAGDIAWLRIEWWWKGTTGGHAHCKILAGGNSDIYTFILCPTMYDRCEVDEKFLLIYTLLKLRYVVCIFWQYSGYYLATNEWIWAGYEELCSLASVDNTDQGGCWGG